jgi:hypothetical protein
MDSIEIFFAEQFCIDNNATQDLSKGVGRCMRNKATSVLIRYLVPKEWAKSLTVRFGRVVATLELYSSTSIRLRKAVM